jgi:hypothetical protein
LRILINGLLDLLRDCLQLAFGDLLIADCFHCELERRVQFQQRRVIRRVKTTVTTPTVGEEEVRIVSVVRRVEITI